MKRDANGKFSTEEAGYGFYSKLLNKPFDTLEELKAEESKVIAAQDAKAAEKEARQVDVKAIQDAAQAYIQLVNANKAARMEMQKAEEEAYQLYHKKLDEFSEKHNGYHLTYVKDGDNVEFKIEENRQDSIAEALKEFQNAAKRAFEGFYYF